MSIKISILTPKRIVCNQTADEIVLPASNGELGILENHVTLVTVIETGLVRIRVGDKWTPMLLSGGVAQIEQNQLIVVVNDVEELNEVTVTEATNLLDSATQNLESATTSQQKVEAEENVKKASARVRGVSMLA